MDNQVLNYSYAINMNDGKSSTKYPMDEMVRKMSRKAGIHSSINTEVYTVSHEILSDVYKPEIKNNLKYASISIGFELTSLQIDTIIHSVWRPSSKTSIEYDIPVRSDTRDDIHTKRFFETPQSDIGSPVFVDLPPGMGKTIVCAISSILFSIERRGEINLPRILSSDTGVNEFTEKEEGGGNMSLVFVPKHVHHQWMRASETAVHILKIMYPCLEFSVYQNRKASSIDSNGFGLIICDSSAFGPTKAIEEGIVYGTICYDECAEISGTKNNAIFAKVPSTIVYGRVILISADFSRMGDTGSKPIQNNTMISKTFGYISSGILQMALCKEYHTYDLHQYLKHGASVVAALTTNSVFSKERRRSVINESAMILSDVHLHTFCVRYRRSVLERLGVSAGHGLTQENGNDLFKDVVGVDISDCSSIDQIMARIKAYGELDHRSYQRTRRVQMALDVLGEVVKEDCVICMDTMERATIIQPCFHVVCGTCSLRIRNCPMCRDFIRGSITSNVTGKRTFDESFNMEKQRIIDYRNENNNTEDCIVQEEVGFLSMGDSVGKGLVSNFNSNSGNDTIKVAMEKTMSVIKKAHEDSGGGTFRGLVICSNVDLNTTGFSADGYEIILYKTKGSREAPITRKKFASQLDKFQADDGNRKLLLVHDSSVDGDGRKDDNITGMDFPKLDVVVSIGSENRSQRIGRLCRMSRMFLQENKRDAIYIELVGV
jgi:hypothetical protein